MKHTLWDALARWILTWLVCTALHIGLGELWQVECRLWLILPVLLVWCALLAAAERFKGSAALPVLWIAAFGLCLLFSDREMLAEAARAIVLRTGEINAYGELVLVLLSTAAAVPLSCLLRLYPARAGLSLAWAGLWITAAILEWPLSPLIPAAMLPLLLAAIIETVRRLRRESEPGEYLKRALVLSLLPAMLLLAVLPTAEEPYGYPLLHRVADAVTELWHTMESALLYRHEGSQEFGVSFNGLADTAEVGSGTGEENPSVIYIKPGRTPDGALYLFGNAWDHFDGHGWSSTLKPEAAQSLNWSMDTAEHLYALWRLLGAQDASVRFSDYFRANNVYLSCRNTNMRTMFGVMNATRVHTDTERFPYADTPTGILFDYVQPDEVWYRISFLESNARTRGELIAAAEGRDYNAEARRPRWYQVSQSFHRTFELDLPNDRNLERAFAERKALIRSVYLDCTGVSERAGALAAEITAGCHTDSEKLAAIAAYLQDNYRYTTSPEPIPKNADFLDWLLFEKKEGYCAWYATAAVLLARSVGVPARYVQGYRSELTGGAYTKLGAKHAHAWCEGYISGYGWITVEATPGFTNVVVGWLTAAEEQALYGKDGAPADTAGVPEKTPIPTPEEEPDENLPEMPMPGGMGEMAGEAVSEPETEPVRQRFTWLSTLLLILLPAGLLGIVLWLRMRKKRRYAQADPTARLEMDLQALLRDLRGKGYPRAPEESLRQYFERLPDFLRTDEAEMRAMTALYDRTFFALKTPTEAELERHRAFAARFRPRTLRQWITWYGLQ